MVPKVSVIIPVYNVEKYVQQSIYSILNQSLKDIEIIIINDGSTDNSLNIIKNVVGDDIRVRIISTPNNGLSIARNIGLCNARGEYVYFFDSDDVLENKALEECYIKSKLQNLDFLFFDAICFTDDNSVIDLSFNYERTNKYEDKVYIGINILEEQLKTKGYRSSACLSFIKRDFLLKENLFFYPKILHEDELFTFLLYLKAKNVGLINEKYFHRRVRLNSIMTNSYSIKNVNGYLSVLQELFKYYKFNFNEVEKRLLLNHIDFLVNSLYVSTYRNFSKDEFMNIRSHIKKSFFYILNLKTQLKLFFPYFLLKIYYKK